MVVGYEIRLQSAELTPGTLQRERWGDERGDQGKGFFSSSKKGEVIKVVIPALATRGSLTLQPQERPYIIKKGGIDIVLG